MRSDERAMMGDERAEMVPVAPCFNLLIFSASAFRLQKMKPKGKV